MPVLSMKLHPIHAMLAFEFSAFRTRLLCVPLLIGFSDRLCTLLTETQITQIPKYPNFVLISCICYRLEDVSCFLHSLCSVVGSQDNRPYQGLFFPLALALDQNDFLSFLCH